MAKRATRRNYSKIDPMFYVPDDVDELIYNDDTEEDAVFTDEEGVSFSSAEQFETGGGVDGGDDSNYDDSPEVPQILGVEFQALRKLPTYTVVDAVLDISEVAGATSYELRVTRT